MEIEKDIPVKLNRVYTEFKPPTGEPRSRTSNVSNDFECLQENQHASGGGPWTPFSSIEDWDYARWIVESDLSQRQIDEMLALDLVSEAEGMISGCRSATHNDLDKVILTILSQQPGAASQD